MVAGVTPPAATATLNVLALSLKLTKSPLKNLVGPPVPLQLAVPVEGVPASHVELMAPLQVMTLAAPVTTTWMALPLSCSVKLAEEPTGGTSWKFVRLPPASEL